tara:strand:+ start:63 stop:488 length:426 start_codon:yes stop_codon:yes gene_type:complete
MKKIPNWEIAFDEFLEKHINTPFQWGKWDCIIFTNEFVKAITKESVLPKSWTWKNEMEALKKIDKYGKGKGLVAGIENAIKKTTGIKEVKPAFIRKGDFGVYKEQSELCCMFDGLNALGVDKDGIVVKDNINVLKAWRIDG